MGDRIPCSPYLLFHFLSPSAPHLDFADPVRLDTHLPGPGGRGELELPTGQETLTTLRDGEGGGEGVGGVGGWWEEGRKWKLLQFDKITKKKKNIGYFMTVRHNYSWQHQLIQVVDGH